MKKTITLILSIIVIFTIFAATKIRIIKSKNIVYESNISGIDSITFTNTSTLHIFKNDNSSVSYLLSEFDSLKFAGTPDTIKIVYSGSSVSISNPLEGQGVTTTVTNADVVISNALIDNEISYLISGTSTDGSFKLYSACKSELILNGLTLTNANGPAINNQSSKKTIVTLPAGTTNTLTDGSSYATSDEDQKGTFFSEGQLIFKGSGSLTVNGNKGHAICSDDYIEIESGVITVPGAVKDGIHAKDHFNLEGGTVNITSTGDAIECEEGKIKVEGGSLTATIATADTKGLKCDSTLTVSGGTINLTVTGNQAKGFKSGGIMDLSGGTIIINTSGAAVLTASGSGYEVSYCTAIKCDTTINISGSSITATSTGTGGKGISSDVDINISGGTINVTNSGNGATYTNSSAVLDAYTGSGIEADGNINISAGNVTVTSSGTGAKGISADGTLTIGSSDTNPVIKVSNTGTKLLVSGTANYTTAVYAEPKALKSDGNMTLNSGIYTISSTQQGAENIDCDTNLSINGGTYTITIGGNQSKALKSTGIMNLNGGTIGITATGGVTLQNVAAATYDPSYCTAIKTTGVLNLNGANITINHSGAGSKCISGDSDVNITSGIIQITTSGVGATYKNSSSVTDSYNASCITTDANLSITSGTLTCSSSGSGGKCISTTGTVTIGSTSTSPTIGLTTSGAKFTVSGTDYCHPKTIVSDGAITINNGTTTISSSDDGMHSETSITLNGGSTTITTSVEGIESKYIYLKGGTTNVISSNDGLNATMGTTSGGTESDDNSLLSISGGTHYISCTSGDAIDSNGDITMTGGVVFANGPSSGVEEAVDFNGTFSMNGGVFVGAGTNSNMTKAMSTSSTQPNMYITSSSQISTSTLFTISIGGTGVVSFKPKYGAYKFLISTPAMTKGSSYIIYTGGSYANETTANGLYYGGTFSNSGASSKKTGTLSSSSTVNTISF
jgi:trimeric autotransporter adhesin